MTRPWRWRRTGSSRFLDISVSIYPLTLCVGPPPRLPLQQVAFGYSFRFFGSLYVRTERKVTTPPPPLLPLCVLCLCYNLAHRTRLAGRPRWIFQDLGRETGGGRGGLERDERLPGAAADDPAGAPRGEEGLVQVRTCYACRGTMMMMMTMMVYSRAG